MGAKKKKAETEAQDSSPKGIISYDGGLHDNWIMLDFKLLNWKFMNFKMKFRDNTHIFTLKKILQEKHGQIADLKICFHSFSEANEIKNEMATLHECGLIGAIPESKLNPKGILAIDDKSLPTVQVFYDFKPSNQSDPVMLFYKKL